jgi:prepilin-type N-terminal cleavage/methylation domain-containing protein
MKRSAFTMMELMIAMGILAVGMAMSASLFPTAAKEANTAIGSAMGQTIAENGLAMGQLAFRSSEHFGDGKVENRAFSTKALAEALESINHPDKDLVPDLNGCRADGATTLVLNSNQTCYPMGTDGKYGFALLARKVSENADAYQIVSTAYLKKDENHTANWDYIKISGGSDNEVTISGPSSASVADGSQAYVNSPLVLWKSGRIATVIAQDGAKLTLDREIEIDGDYAIVLRETDAGRSPAIYTMTVTTALDD